MPLQFALGRHFSAFVDAFLPILAKSGFDVPDKSTGESFDVQDRSHAVLVPKDRDKYAIDSSEALEMTSLDMVSEICYCSDLRISSEVYCSTDDIIARWGGDEFFAVFTKIAGLEKAWFVCYSVFSIFK